MNVEVPPPPAREPEFLLHWEESRDRGRAFRAGTLSIGAHAVAIIALLTTPFGKVILPRVIPEALRATPLVAPPEELTQTAPNKGKISKEFDIASLMPHPVVPPAPQLPARIRTPLPLQPAPRRAAPEASKPLIMPEPPEIQTAHAATPALPPIATPSAAPPAPQIQQQEHPKLAFESVDRQAGSRTGLGQPRLKAPGGSMEETIQGAMRGGAGGISVGDEGESGLGSLGGLSIPPSPGRAGSSLELLSDPNGVDFRPYLARILILVRRNWRVVFPESARLGQRGKVITQFAIARDGSVPKLVLALESGTRALDQAAVSAISMSVPFPDLPAGYKSDRVRLQLTFLYNIK